MLNPDFRDMLSCLKGAGVEFIVVGAYALAAQVMNNRSGWPVMPGVRWLPIRNLSCL